MLHVLVQFWGTLDTALPVATKAVGTVVKVDAMMPGMLKQAAFFESLL